MALLRNPRQYRGVRAVLPPDLQTANRVPTAADKAYVIGTLWLDTVAQSVYMYAAPGVWVLLGGATGAVATLTGDSGTATPAAGNIKIAGTANQITTTAAGSTVTLSLAGPYVAATYLAHAVLVGEGTSGIGVTNVGTAGQILTSNGPGVDPSFQTAGGGTTSDFADFYALMPGDNAATVAVGAAILLPNDGPSSGTSITRLSSSTFQLADIATYSISFQCSFDEAGQMQLAIGGVGLAYTVSGRATGTNQVYINALYTTSGVNEVLSVINPAGNAAALTITPIAGGTHAVSAHLVIQRVAGGPGGGLLNTINSIVPVAGNIVIAGTASEITVTNTAGTATLTIPAAFIAPGSVAATTSLTATLGNITATNGDLVLGTTGNKLKIHASTAASDSIGISVALDGASPSQLVVSTTAVKTGSIILLSYNTAGGTLGSLSVGAIVDSTSFQIKSSANGDTSTVNYLIIN